MAHKRRWDAVYSNELEVIRKEREPNVIDCMKSPVAFWLKSHAAVVARLAWDEKEAP